MRAIVFVGLAVSSYGVSALDIVGYDGKEMKDVRQHHHKKHHKKHRPGSSNKSKHLHFKVAQHKIAGHAHAHHLHNLLNHKEHVQPTPALDLMKRIAGTVIPRTHHPALAEIVKVAEELVESKDETLAAATVETFHESLLKLSEVSREDPQATGAIADMRADVCGSSPDAHKDECMGFMKAYCAANDGKEACANFFKTDEKPAPKEKAAAKQEAKKEVKKQEKKDDGPPPEPIPEQGFSGKPVAHVDGETATDDWRREFGPGQGDTYESVCAEHPTNDWCTSHGYAPLFHSGASEMRLSFTTCVASLISVVALVGAPFILY